MSGLQEGLARLGGLMQRRDIHAVEALLPQLLAAYPDSAELHELRAVHAYKLGRREDALAAIAVSAALEPAAVALQCRLGRLAHAIERPQRAAELFAAAVKADPGCAEAWLLLGTMQASLGRFQEAISSLWEGLRLDPGNDEALRRLSDLEFDHGLPRDALPVMQRLCARWPGDADSHLKLGVILGRLADHAAAAAVYRAALEQMPGNADLWTALAQSLEYLGERVESEAAYRQACRLRPGWALPVAGLLGLLRRDAPSSLVEEAERLLADAHGNDAGRAVLGYELGKLHDAHARYPQAMASWELANTLRTRMIGRFDAAKVRDLVARTRAVFAGNGGCGGQPATDRDGAAPRPVLIVGMPRSGTTLTEQIIAAHPAAHGCGELLDLTLLANHLGDAEGRDWPEAVVGIDAVRCAAMRESYLQSAMRHVGMPVDVLVDKAPLNFFFLGLAARLFPELRVIWCRREPRDVAVSIFGENFSLDAPFATSFEGIAEYMWAEQTLMRHWHEMLGVPVLEMRYETLVSDTEGEARRLLQHVGLPWDARCLQFHQSGAVVQTPSRWQVRQPTHTRSVARWRNYSDWLQGLEARLAELSIEN